MNLNRQVTDDDQGINVFDRLFDATTGISTRTYFFLTMASILGSAWLYLSGKRHTSIFVGEWAPTFLVLALFNKLLNPTRGNVGERIGEAVHSMTH